MLSGKNKHHFVNRIINHPSPQRVFGWSRFLLEERHDKCYDFAFFIVEWNHIYMSHLFKESIVEGQVGSFWFLSVVFCAVVNTDMQVCGMLIWRSGKSLPKYPPVYNDESSNQENFIIDLAYIINQICIDSESYLRFMRLTSKSLLFFILHFWLCWVFICLLFLIIWWGSLFCFAPFCYFDSRSSIYSCWSLFINHIVTKFKDKALNETTDLKCRFWAQKWHLLLNQMTWVFILNIPGG